MRAAISAAGVTLDDLRRIPMHRRRWHLEVRVGVGLAFAIAFALDRAASAWAGYPSGRVFLSTMLVLVVALVARGLTCRRIRWELARATKIEAGGRLAALERILEHARWHPPLMALAAYRLAEHEVLDGDGARGRRLLEALSDRGWQELDLGPDAWRCASRLAVVHALRDDRPEALASAMRAEREGGVGAALLARLVLCLRRSDPMAAAALIEARLPAAEAHLTRTELQSIHVLWAFAVHQLAAGAYRDDPRRRRSHEILAGARPLDPTTLRWLTSRWPALESFLARHELTDRGARRWG